MFSQVISTSVIELNTAFVGNHRILDTQKG